MASVSATRLLRAVFVQTTREFLLLPFWWYTEGFLKMLALWRQSIGNVSATFGLGIWVKNLFVPMYGDTSFVGRLISFGIRFFMILIRGFGVMMWALLLSLM